MKEKKNLYVQEMDSPIGTLTMVVSNQGLCRVDFGDWEENVPLYQKWAARYFTDWEWKGSNEKTKKLSSQISEYFHGKRKNFTLEPDFYGTDFQVRVWKAMYEGIPFGETRTYKQIAEAVGSPRAFRAVGGALNKNPVAIIVPCHRVIGSDGTLTGFGGGMEKKEVLLNLEKNAAIE